MRPQTLKSVQELAAAKPHGTRIRYMAGCRCLPCRASNTNYETMRARRRRQGLWNGLVSARRARRHIHHLSFQGVGYKTVADVSGMSRSVVFKIRSGQRRQIRMLSEKRILEVDKRSIRGSTLIPAKATWQKINWLISEGFTRGRIARMLGAQTAALQLRRDFVAAKTAKKVEELWRKYQ